jgi:hypothetical protein
MGFWTLSTVRYSRNYNNNNNNNNEIPVYLRANRPKANCKMSMNKEKEIKCKKQGNLCHLNLNSILVHLRANFTGQRRIAK